MFLVLQMERAGNNPKPVVLHSIRVALYLYDQGYGRDIVVAAALHDLLEDSDTTPRQIEREFGPEVARLVEANTFDRDIADEGERDREMLLRCEGAGGDAMLIKAADILDNSRRWGLGPGDALSERLLRKVGLCLELSGGALGDEPVRGDLGRECRSLRAEMGPAAARG